MARMVAAITIATLACVLYVAYAVPLQRETRDVNGTAVPGLNTTVSDIATTTVVPTVKKDEVEICYNNSACGWEIYIPISKEIVDYMSNSCECHELYHCVRWDDNISLSAYIYECRIKSERAREPGFFVSSQFADMQPRS